jgi:hypothetical protein
MPRLISIGVLFLLIGAGIGYVVAQYRFGYPTPYELNGPLGIVWGAEVGSLPRGTHMNYRSAEHGEVEFYVVVRVPQQEAQLLLKRLPTDHYNGHRHLKAKQ